MTPSSLSREPRVEAMLEERSCILHPSCEYENIVPIAVNACTFRDILILTYTEHTSTTLPVNET